MKYATINTFKHAILLTCMTLVTLILIPHQTEAYFTTAQKEIDLGNGTGLFLIEYRFGMEKRDVQLPVLTRRGEKKLRDTVSYEIVNKDGEKAKGVANGFVLSTAKIDKDRMYVAKRGEAQTFTLAVFFTPETPDMDEYRLQVTYLPFTFNKKQELQLNPSELTYYTTDLLPL